jgi:hypothetical protein
VVVLPLSILLSNSSCFMMLSSPRPSSGYRINNTTILRFNTYSLPICAVLHDIIRVCG